MRPDLPKGVLAAQVTHAAGESSTGKLDRGTYAVVLQAPREGLEELEERFKEEAVPHTAIRETMEPYCGELMAIGVRPAPREEVRRLLSSYPLLR